MVRSTKRWIYGFMLMVLLIPVIAACGGQQQAQPTAAPAQPTAAPAQPTAAPASDLAALRGDILIDGSSTVYPVTAAAAEEFSKLAPNVRVSVGISGTGGGFKKF
ncbi:substrate-binding domain-containing protein, partial [uncultured Chloroflexus sp.]|uniref:substrate-binding domain-containing protein n=1 Tax=uncultured Chloroflexus sp. TaxID=214040 RepID=UPI003456B597